MPSNPDKPIISILTDTGLVRAAGAEIADLLTRIGQMDDVTLTPAYYLERNELRGAPIVVLIRQAGLLIAVLYGRERRILGLRTGFVQFGDYYGDGGVLAEDSIKASAIRSGITKVLLKPRIHTVRFSFKPGNAIDSTILNSTFDSSYLTARMMPEDVQHNLTLRDTFDAFLSTLGSHTRRNLRVYRRRVEQKGWKFVPCLQSHQVAHAFATLEKLQGNHKSSRHYLNCCRATLNAVPGPYFAGIQTDAGDWVSISAGWIRGDRFFMLVQLNDKHYARDSISIVMRSYLIEDLILKGVRRINFIGGSSDMLRRFCDPQTCSHFLIEKRRALAVAQRHLASIVFKNSMASRILRGNPAPISETESSPA